MVCVVITTASSVRRCGGAPTDGRGGRRSALMPAAAAVAASVGVLLAFRVASASCALVYLYTTHPLGGTALDSRAFFTLESESGTIPEVASYNHQILLLAVCVKQEGALPRIAVVWEARFCSGS